MPMHNSGGVWKTLLIAVLVVYAALGCFPGASAQECASYTNCTTCLSAPCVWCGQENKCALSTNDCTVNNVTIYATHAISTRPMIDCLSGVITTASQCPTFTVKIIRDFADSGINMVIPIQVQPILQIDDQPEATSKDPFYIDVVGTYFTTTPEYETRPKFFSLNYFADKLDSYKFSQPVPHNVSSTFITNSNVTHYLFTKNASFVDLAIVGSPGTYRVGFAVARVSLVASGSNRSQCAFVTSSQDIAITPEYQNIYLGTQLLLGLPVLIIGVVLASVAAFRCKHAFKDEDGVNHTQTDTDGEISPRGYERQQLRGHQQQQHRSFDGSVDLESPTNHNAIMEDDIDLTSQPSEDNITVPAKARGYTNVKTLSAAEGSARPPYKKLMLALVNHSDAELIQKSGTDVYFFLWFQKLTIAYMIVCALISFAALLPLNRLADAYSAFFFEDFAATTIAAIGLEAPNSLLGKTPINPGDAEFIDAGSAGSSWVVMHVLVVALFLILGCVFLWRVLKLGRIVVKGDRNYSSLFTVQVKGLSSDIIDPRELREHFVEQYGAEGVVSVHIAWNMENLIAAVKRREDHHSKLVAAQEQLEKTGVRPTHKEAWYRTTKFDAIEYHTQHINALDKYIRQFKNPDSIHGSGIAFVTFATPDIAKQCIKDYGSFWFQLKTFFAGKFMESSSWSVKAAPEVLDVCWENLGYGSFDRLCRSFAITIGLVLLLCIVYLVTFFTSVYHYWRVQYGAEYAGFNTIFMLVLDLLPELISVINEVVAPTISAVCRFEKHQTRNKFINAYLRRIILFMLLNTLVIPRIFSIHLGQQVAGSQPPFSTYHYLFNTTGSEMVKYLIAQAFIAKGLELFFIFLGMMIEYKVTKKITRPEYDYGTNYGIRISVMFALIVWGALVPAVFLPGLAYFFIAYFVDKWLIMHLYQRGRESDGAILYQVSSNISTYLLMIPIAIAVILSRSVGAATLFLATFGTIALWFMLRRVRNYGDRIRNQSVAVDADGDSASTSSSSTAFTGAGPRGMIRSVSGRLKDLVIGRETEVSPSSAALHRMVPRNVLAKQYEHPYRRYTSL